MKRGRGSNTHGHGTHKRGRGRSGGAGMAGVKDARWMTTIKGGKVPMGARKGKFGHLGKYGFTRGRLSHNPNTINVSWLNQFNGKVDLADLGIEKLLGSGKLAKPLKVKVASWSANAEKKIKAAGGEITQ